MRFGTEADRIVVGRRLAWLYDRPAFDGRFTRTVQQPLLDALRTLRRQNRTMFDRLADQVPEIGVSTDQNVAIHIAEGEKEHGAFSENELEAGRRRVAEELVASVRPRSA